MVPEKPALGRQTTQNVTKPSDKLPGTFRLITLFRKRKKEIVLTRATFSIFAHRPTRASGLASGNLPGTFRLASGTQVFAIPCLASGLASGNLPGTFRFLPEHKLFEKALFEGSLTKF